jgi:hypothetical protein
MTDQRQHADAPAADASRSASRRAAVGGLGASAAAALAGCNGFGRQYAYESGEVGDVGGSARNASERATAEAVAETEIDESLSPLDAIDLEDHEFVLEDGYEGSTVQGRLRNAGDERLRDVEVRVRVRDDEGRHRGRFVASTGDLSPGTSWAFTVVLLVAPADVGGYDIAALGMTA